MKVFEFTCPKHGKVRVEVEKPPMISAYVKCPFCDRLARAVKLEEKAPESIWARGWS